MKRFATIAAACALALAGAATAGSDKPADTTSVDVPYSDAMFFAQAAAGGMAEVDADKLAASKGNSADVRGFGQKMITDHTKKNAELAALAAKKGVTLPARTDAAHQQMLDELRSLSGDAFDLCYAGDMVTGHEKMAALLEQAARDSKDADIRMFATDTLKAVHAHHALAADLQKTEMAEAGDND